MCKNVFDMREATDGDTSNAIAIGILALVEVVMKKANKLGLEHSVGACSLVALEGAGKGVKFAIEDAFDVKREKLEGRARDI
eukprot:jgi/Bigna1/138327/aug1.44_g13035